MSSVTRFLKLVKPAIDEAYDVTIFNDNYDKIDKEFGETRTTDAFVSEDEEDPLELATMPEVMANGDDRATLFNKISVVVKNVRYLIKLIGNTDISELGNGTITNILSLLNDDCDSINNNLSDITNDISDIREEMNEMGFPDLDYSHPLHSGVGTYTANQICYLVGSVNCPSPGAASSASSSCSVNGKTIAYAYAERGNAGDYQASTTCTIPTIKLNIGDVVVLSGSVSAHVFPLKS